MARPSDTKARIQAVARELFAEQGVRNTSLRQISERLGITKPALYYHFASRDELVGSIVQPLIDDLAAFAERCAPGDAQQVLDDYFDLMWRHRETIVMIVRDVSALGYQDLGSRMFAWRRQLIALLLGPDPAPAAHVHATVALGGLSDCVVEYAHLPFEEVKAAAVNAALAALGLDR